MVFGQSDYPLECGWTVFAEFIETQNLFLLFTSEFAFNMIPKRCLGASAAEVGAAFLANVGRQGTAGDHAALPAPTPPAPIGVGSSQPLSQRPPQL